MRFLNASISDGILKFPGCFGKEMKNQIDLHKKYMHVNLVDRIMKIFSKARCLKRNLLGQQKTTPVFKLLSIELWECLQRFRYNCINV